MLQRRNPQSESFLKQRLRKSSGRDHERRAHVVNEVQIYYLSINDNLLVHIEEIEEDDEFENVDEVENLEGMQVEATGIPPVDPVSSQHIM